LTNPDHRKGENETETKGNRRNMGILTKPDHRNRGNGTALFVITVDTRWHLKTTYGENIGKGDSFGNWIDRRRRVTRV